MSATTSDFKDLGGTELFYRLGERLFASAAPAMAGLGWSIFPQEFEGPRRPGRVHGDVIRIREEHDLENRLPSAAAMEAWCRHCPGLNVACVFGPASGNTFSLDIDITDAAMSAAVAKLAGEVLGRTPFRRVGRAPKIAFTYRHAPGDAVRSVTRRLAGEGGHAVEVLGRAKILTFHGVHHATGRYFKWLHPEGNPLLVGPEAAPLVKSAQVDEFLEAVGRQFGYARPVAAAAWAAAGGTEAVNVDGYEVRIPTQRGVRDEAGRVIDGRYEYLTSLGWGVVRANRAQVTSAAAEGEAALDEARRALTQVCVQAFSDTAECRGRWEGASLAEEAAGAVGSAVAKLLAGKMEAISRPPAPRLSPWSRGARRQASGGAWG